MLFAWIQNSLNRLYSLQKATYLHDFYWTKNGKDGGGQVFYSCQQTKFSESFSQSSQLSTYSYIISYCDFKPIASVSVFDFLLSLSFRFVKCKLRAANETNICTIGGKN